MEVADMAADDARWLRDHLLHTRNHLTGIIDCPGNGCDGCHADVVAAVEWLDDAVAVIERKRKRGKRG